MSTVIETRATFGDSFQKNLTAKMFDLQNEADMAYSLAIDSALGVEENNYTRLFKDYKSSNAREFLQSKTGIGFLQVTQEGEDYKSDSRVSGYRTEFNWVFKTSGITITKLDRDDRMVDSKLDEMRDIMVSGKMTKDRDAFSIFNYAFTAQASLPVHLTYYGDSKPLASVAHPLKASTTSTTTFSNASATSIALTEVNLETGRTALRRALDDKGLPMNVGSGRVILLVPDALEKQACIITKSQLRSNTANNDLNVYRDGVVTVISTKWINSQNGGSDTQWFLIDSMNSPFIFFERQAFETDVWTNPANKNVTADISVRYQVGNRDWRGFWGSKGDGSTYTG
jgi:hypothetical protein